MLRTQQFSSVKGHNIPEQVIQNAIESGRNFFDLPLEEKLKVFQHLGFLEH
jgi:isopenicillin N synthase-like dioxygenase